MKPSPLLPAILMMIFLLLFGCGGKQTIDEIYPWPVSGVPAADSLLLEIERVTFSDEPFSEKRITRRRSIEKFCSIAATHPDNAALQSRRMYLEAMDMAYMGREKYNSKVKEALALTDSVRLPYEYHVLKTLDIDHDLDLVKKYNVALSNIAFFKERNSPVELGRNLVLAGNVMSALQDTVQAIKFVEQAESIYRHLNIPHGVRIAKNNRAIISSEEEKVAIYRELLADSTLPNDPTSYVLVLQNYAISVDSLELLHKAVDVFNRNEIDHTNLGMVFNLLGYFYTMRGEAEKGLQYILNGMDTTAKYSSDNMGQYLSHNNFLADTYYMLGMKDSCIEALSRARVYNDLYLSQKRQASVYATDAAERIRMAEKTARLEKERTMRTFIIAILVLCIGVIWWLFLMRRREAEKRHEETLMQERYERNLQSIRALSKVMEESDQLLDTIGGKINELKCKGRISEESAESIARILKIHRSNEDNRQGFLKVQQELDTRFVMNLKHDFPELSESQTKLASLIAAGLDTRQICNILNIEPASVHKSRYRLRSRLRLAKNQSLEEFLRTYIRPDVR